MASIAETAAARTAGHSCPRHSRTARMIAGSRVYVGTHYVSDILGGAATGVIAASLVRAFYREGTRLDRFATEIL